MEENRAENASSVSQSTPTTQSSSHYHHIPTASFRNEHRARQRHSQLIRPTHLFFFILLICFLSPTHASVYISESMIELSDLERSLADLATTGTILVDPNPPPDPKAWTLATEHDDLLQRRDDPANQDDSSSTTSSTKHAHTSSSSISSVNSMVTTATTPTATKSGSAGSGTSTAAIVAATDSTSTSLPTPFDQGFASNITQTCSDFMYGFLTNATFQSCLPFSLLLQSSNSFFQTTKSILRTTQLLDHTCAASPATCNPYIAGLASNISNTHNCAEELRAENPLIQQAQLGLLAYQPLFTASCLRSASNSYCFADAVTNASSPTDSYIYYLPLNISLPGGSQPTCDSCLQNTMSVFENTSANRSSVLAGNYVGAAQMINLQCGPDFVAQTLAPEVKSAASSIGSGANVGAFALAMVVGSWLL